MQTCGDGISLRRPSAVTKNQPAAIQRPAGPPCGPLDHKPVADPSQGAEILQGMLAKSPLALKASALEGFIERRLSETRPRQVPCARQRSRSRLPPAGAQCLSETPSRPGFLPEPLTARPAQGEERDKQASPYGAQKPRGNVGGSENVRSLSHVQL